VSRPQPRRPALAFRGVSDGGGVQRRARVHAPVSSVPDMKVGWGAKEGEGGWGVGKVAAG